MVRISVISGSSNLRLSTVEVHDSCDSHQQTIREKEHADAKSISKSLPEKIQQRVSPDLALVTCIQCMGKNDRDTLSILHDISYYTAL